MFSRTKTRYDIPGRPLTLISLHSHVTGDAEKKIQTKTNRKNKRYRKKINQRLYEILNRDGLPYLLHGLGSWQIIWPTSKLIVN